MRPPAAFPPASHNFNCNGNDCFKQNSCEATVTKDPITDENIFSLMNNQPISWKVYAQNYLNAGGNVNVPDFTSANQPPFTNYYARHNAAVWYEEILSNTLGSQGNIVDFEQFGIDVANGTLPRFAIIVPDGCWDLHDECSNLTNGDNFLNSNLTPMLNSPDFQAGGSGLVIVTFDNGAGDDVGQVYTALIGPNVKPGHVSNISYKHENTLRTMLDALGINTHPGWSASAADMSDFFSSTAGSVVINSPANGFDAGRVRAGKRRSLGVKRAGRSYGSVGHLQRQSNKTRQRFQQDDRSGFPRERQWRASDDDPGYRRAPSYKTLHKQVTNYTRSSTYGVVVNTPANSSTQATLFPLSAFAVEASAERSSSGIDHIEVWNGDTKLGDSPRGTSVSQWYSLEPGSYTLTVQDVTGSEVRLHETKVSFTVSSRAGGPYQLARE